MLYKPAGQFATEGQELYVSLERETLETFVIILISKMATKDSETHVVLELSRRWLLNQITNYVLFELG